MSINLGYSQNARTFWLQKKFSLRNTLVRLSSKLGQKQIKDYSFNDFKDSNWVLTFEDNFDSFDAKKWMPQQNWGDIHPLYPYEYYSKDAIVFRNGFLRLQTLVKPTKKIINSDTVLSKYACGLINSYHSFRQQYGYFEIRAKIPKHPAIFPAFWLTGTQSWPPEIDIFEFYGRADGLGVEEFTTNIHWGSEEEKTHRSMVKKYRFNETEPDSFNTYGCNWGEKRIVFYLNGEKIRVIKIPKAIRSQFNQEMVLIINNLLHNKHLGDIDDEELPYEIVVDWVRAYQK